MDHWKYFLALYHGEKCDQKSGCRAEKNELLINVGLGSEAALAMELTVCQRRINNEKDHAGSLMIIGMEWDDVLKYSDDDQPPPTQYPLGKII